MKRSDAFPSKYFSKEDVTVPLMLTIESVTMETFDSDKGKRDKPILYFADEDSKPMVLNNGNWLTIEGLYGEESDNWTGRLIELYNDPNVMFGKKRVGGIRVRAPHSNGKHESVTDPKTVWMQFYKANALTQEIVEATLGTVKVSEWLESNAGRTIQDAMEMFDAQQPEYVAF